jgi:hypothetical protein
MDVPLILAIVFGLLIVGLLVAFIVLIRGREKFTPNYRALFVMGIIWLGAGIPLGISTGNSGLWVMGLIFFMIGLLNRDKWEEEKKWSDLSQGEKSLKIFLMIGLSVLLLAGAAFMILLNATS